MASRLYPYCLMRWETGAWGEEQLNTAVTKNYITEEEKTAIMAQPQQTA
ncbi:XkdX family protein [Brevibacillus agri]|nr:XkdX family protein [Brevibacillus agri]MBY0052994.1 XkdX family protein [Brevibacillus agri]